MKGKNTLKAVANVEDGREKEVIVHALEKGKRREKFYQKNKHREQPSTRLESVKPYVRQKTVNIKGMTLDELMEMYNE